MQWTSAPNIGEAPLPQRARGYWKTRISAGGEALERFLERERAQLPPWLAVGFGFGIAAWFALDRPVDWAAFLCMSAAVALTGLLFRNGRAGRALSWFALAATLGCGLVWIRAERVASPRVERPIVTEVSGTIERIDYLAAKDSVRLTLRADAPLPPRIRVSLDEEDQPAGLAPGAGVRVRARIAPPPQMALPGTYDFARDAWFKGIGGVGKALGPVRVVDPVESSGLDHVRESLRRHIGNSLGERQAGIAIALATGDQNSIDQADAEAMRRSGLTHLLSVSGLHIAAAVAIAMLLALKFLALSERLALRFNLVLVAAGAGAAAGVAYTLLTGAQVPTVRSCIAALLFLAGIALGREAMSMRLVATGAIVVLLFRPEALAGASFQMSFAAVTAIVALHSSPTMRRLFERRDEGLLSRLIRGLSATLLTGLAVELVMIPLALFHFHRTGLYGVAANIIGIPLTTFVIMPAEAAALVLDSLGAGKPLWVVTSLALDALLGIAHWVGSARGAVAMLPSMPGWAFGLMVAGGLWLCLWNGRVRLLGLAPALLGAVGAASASTPDLLVTGDGRHLAIVAPDGVPMLLRERSGDYIQTVMAEAAAFDGEPAFLGTRPASHCSRDSCVVEIGQGAQRLRLLAIRSAQRIDWTSLTRACAQADIAVADRRLPRGCTPRWLKLDRRALEQTGGVAIFLGDPPRVDTVADRVGAHPWAM